MLGLGVIAGLALTLVLAPFVAVATPVGGESLDNAQQQSQQDLILACATTTTTATTLGEELLDGRSGMETVQYPSQSPSMSMPCSDAFSNARGSYTSLMAPCVVTFHNGGTEADAGDDSGSSGENVQRHHHKDASSPSLVSTYYHGTSSVCGTENTIGEAKEYVSAWPDECVGDFARCYDLKDPNHLLCPALQNLLKGLQHQRRLEEASVSASTAGGGAPPPPPEHTALVPPKTTPISIDCTIDREALIKSYEQQAQVHAYTHDRTGYQENAFFAVVLVLVAALIVVFAVSHLVVQPIVGAIGEASGSQYFFRHSEHGPGEGGNQLASLVTRIEIDGDIDIDINGDDEFGHEGADHLTHLEVLAPDEMEAIADPIHLHLQEHQQQQQQQQQHTIQVIPIDYDIVPLVPVTILSDEVIHAEVVQDGVTYYP